MSGLCSLETFGYRTSFQKNMVYTVGVATALSGIAGVVMGVLGLYGVIPNSTALFTQVGLFGAVAVLSGVAIAASGKVKSKIALAIGVISLLALPVLFGSLGAMHVIHSHNMLWAATSMFGGVVLASFAFSMCTVAKDCCENKDD